ncbi:MAG: uroporphyrinogen-III C-methyltransferase [Proteobacteria bacterium]|nr:uroporphyrinogen-III C-methyltransferase [Pseudomonadota bacterium]
MSGNDPTTSSAASTRRPQGRILLWSMLLALLALGAWQTRGWWWAHVVAGNAGTGATVAPGADDSGEPIGDPAAAIAALRREQRDLAQRMSDTTAGQQVLRDEVLGVGERAALLEQSVSRIASPRGQGEQALRLDEAELLLTIGQQQIELAADTGAALHAYALADDVLAGSSDPSVLNLRQSLAQEVAAMKALPPDPRAFLGGRLDAFEASLDAQPFDTATDAPAAKRPSVFDRVVGSLVEVRHAPAQDLLDPASRDAALTAIRLEITLARLALERRDAAAFHAALGRIDRWLPRLYSADTVARQRALLADLQRAPVRLELPSLGGTLTELRRLRQEQPPPTAVAASTAVDVAQHPAPAPAPTHPAPAQPPPHR